MRPWRYYPLAGHPTTGLLVSPDREPSPAMFLTPEQAKERYIRGDDGKRQ